MNHEKAKLITISTGKDGHQEAGGLIRLGSGISATFKAEDVEDQVESGAGEQDRSDDS